MNEYLTSFLISLGAGLITPLFRQKSDKTIEKSLENYFHEALWDWTADNDDRKTKYSLDNYRDLLNYLDEGGKSLDPDIEELIVRWQNKLMADSVTSAFLTNFKLDKTNSKLSAVDDRLATVDGKIDNLDTKIDRVHTKIETILSDESKVVNIIDEETSKKAFRKKKDLEHLQNLMEAFSL